MNRWWITGFGGINNCKDTTALKQPARQQPYGGGEGIVELETCVNFAIDDDFGLIKREASPAIFTKDYDAKLTQILGARTFSASGTDLRYTRPFSADYDEQSSTIRMPAVITMLQEIETGMWVGTTEAIYFFDGVNPTALEGFVQRRAYDQRAIMGTGEKVPRALLGLDGAGFVAVFATETGICFGDQSGALENLSEGVFSYAPGQRGVSHINIANGFAQYQVRMINESTSYNPRTIRTSFDMDVQ